MKKSDMAALTTMGTVGEKFLHFPMAHIRLPISDNWQLYAYLKPFPSYKAFYLALPYMGKYKMATQTTMGTVAEKF
ncbi:MAG: hypothetical protein ACYSO3_04720 [Planctomycetota bacterium]|jgi:hypothetical protein